MVWNDSHGGSFGAYPLHVAEYPRNIVGMIASLAHTPGLMVIAEGVGQVRRSQGEISA